LIMTIGLLPDASRTPAGRLPDALKPGIHCVRTHWIRGFMTFRRVRHARIVMLMVPACPESGFLERAARPPPTIGSTALRSSYEASVQYEGVGMGGSGGV
jgi:hypothetical protein